MRISVQDIIKGTANVPFTSRAAWLSSQKESAELRRVRAHLIQGTRPSKKLTHIRDIKRYLGVATIAKDGLLVVKKTEPLAPCKECIIVPQEVLYGLLTALHIKLKCPTKHQMKLVMQRSFYALDMDKAIADVTDSCHTCASLMSMPKELVSQSTSDPPPTAGIQFAADIMKRNKQLIFILRECTTSYTVTCIVENEKGDTLANALVQSCMDLRPLDGPYATVRVDPAPGFLALRNSPMLTDHRICLEIGEAKNVNKNPVAEKAVQELGTELLKHEPTGGAVTPLTLAIVTARLNARLRRQGLSAREMWFQRDQYTNVQLPIEDRDLIMKQHDKRLANHPHSSRSKAPAVTPIADSADLYLGALVYLKSDRSKSHARERYIIVSMDREWCCVKKFTGSQFRAHSYKVKQQDCYLVQPNLLPYHQLQRSLLSEDSDHEYELEDEPVHIVRPPPAPPPAPPLIPHELARPMEEGDVPRNLGNEDTLNLLPEPIHDDSSSIPDTQDSQINTPVGDTEPSASAADQDTADQRVGRRFPRRQRRRPPYLKDYECDS